MGGFLGGVGDFLFGEDSSVTNQQLPTLTPEQKAFLDRLLPLIEGRLGSGGESTNTELLSLEGLSNLVNQASGLPGGSGVQSQATGTASKGLTALDQILEAGPQDIDAFFKASVQDPLLEAFSEDILPAIQTRFAPQFFGGERRESEARAREDLVDTLARERTKFGFESREAQEERRLRGAAAAPSVAGGAAAVPFAGQAARQGAVLPTVSAGVAQGGAPDQRRLDEMNRRIREALAAIGLPAFENVTTVDQGSAGLIPGLATGLAGNAGFGAALGGLIFSSEEFKEDFGPASVILDALDELEIKSWRYKPEVGLGTDKHVGPMAEDFYEIFGLGNGKVIPTVDAVGVTMQSVKELSRKVKLIEEALA